MILASRRWQLVDQWDHGGGYFSYRIIGRYWTKAGALSKHAVIRPFLRNRAGQASILLQDCKTGNSRVLSTQ